MRASISTKEIKASIESELDTMYQTGALPSPLKRKFESPLLIYKAINDADREICLYEKIAGNVSIFVPKDQNTVFFDRQEEFFHKFQDQVQSAFASSQPGFYSWMLEEQQFLDVVSVLSSDMSVYGSIPFKSETEETRVKLGTYQQLRAENDHTRAHVEPNRRKLMLSTPFDADKWVTFYAQLAPYSFDIMEYNLDEISGAYSIMAPGYTKAWLLIKALNKLLPNTILQQEGLIEDQETKRQKAARLRPGSGNVIIEGDELDWPYEYQFADFMDIRQIWGY